MEADMPNGIFPVPAFDSRPGDAAGTRPSRAVRLRARWRPNRLDGQLAHGTDPATSPELDLRAAQLRSRRERSRIANALIEILGDARKGAPVTIKVRPQRAQIRAAADDLLELVARLRDDEPVSVRGAAMAARLLSDSTSPLRRHGGQDVQHAIRAARFALDTVGTAEHDLAAAA
jgi:hypothetical protein